jgi:hypothetical protein
MGLSLKASARRGFLLFTPPALCKKAARPRDAIKRLIAIRGHARGAAAHTADADAPDGRCMLEDCAGPLN